jgi:predicted nucleic acid-binding protein
MLVVSNTSPISNLAIIRRLDLLRVQFSTVTIPPGVHAELANLPDLNAKARIALALQNGWVQTAPLAGTVPADLESALDRGEAEALALALERKADFVLLDESTARLEAQRLGLRCVGVLGILRQAKASGRIPSLKAEVTRLRIEARFFIASALEKQLLQSVGED